MIENPKIGGRIPVPKRMIIAITGASGVIYGIQMLRALRNTPYETHLIISEPGSRNIEIETGLSPDEIKQMADYTYLNTDVGATLASGSFITEGMVVIPCTVKTLSGIANCYTDSLIIRAADVTLKEKRKLVLVVRETPLHQGHLRLMTMAADMGAHLLPPVPSFYHQPKTIEDLINHTVGKVFDYFQIEHDLFKRWGS
jgi:4-hydroxy-3-polyprenylbenzoate decarboxylase